MEFKVGQTWRRRNGKEVVIRKIGSIAGDGISCDDSMITHLDGFFHAGDGDSPYDLVDLVCDVASDAEVAATPIGTVSWYLREASKKIADRGAEYDVPGGERSMVAVVKAFNALLIDSAGPITTTQGWLFMALVKMKRLLTVESGGSYHEDSAIDLIAYCALTAEAAEKSSLASLRSGA